MGDISTETIDLAKSGDARALETVVRAVQDRLYRLAVRMLADPQAAQASANAKCVEIPNMNGGSPTAFERLIVRSLFLAQSTIFTLKLLGLSDASGIL